MGVTDTTEPTWPTTAGGTVVDGGVTWTEIGSTVLGQAGLTRANIVKNTYKWPLGSKQSSVNQIKGKFRDAKNDFALTPFTVNDRAHQALVKKIYPLELDLSAVDNWNQAYRIANAILSKNREGDWFNSLETGPQGLVLEEGDVICASDDSGGLINVVTRIEELRIKPNHDVSIAFARKYSTLMFSDDVGQHTIPLPSVLRYRQTVDSLVEFIDNFPIRDEDALTPGFYVAVSRDLSDLGDWRGWALYADYGDGYVKIAEGDIPAKIGEATTTLGTVTDPSVFDRVNSVTFTLKYGPPAPAPAPFATVTEQELLSHSRRNLFLIDDEYVQAATVVDNGDQSYTISTLLRGRFGTDSTQLVHGATERVVYLDGSEKFVTIDPVRLNGAYNYKAVTTNQDVADATPVSFTWTGGNIKPLAPVNLQGVRDVSGNLLIKWTRRSRFAPGLRSYSDLPLAEEQERYLVEIYSGATLKRSWQVDKTVFTPILWTIHPDSPDGAEPEGGITHSEFDTGSLTYSQQAFTDDVTLVFTASDQGPELPSYVSVVSSVPPVSAVFDDLWYWQGGAFGTWDAQPEKESSLLVTAVAKDRFTIEIKGGVARYYFKSALIYTSLVKTEASPLRVATSTVTGRNQYLGTAHIQGIATNAHYSQLAQSADAVGPSGIKVRVRQLSSVVGQGDFVESYL